MSDTDTETGTAPIPSLNDITDSIAGQVPQSANRSAFAKSIQSILQKYPDVGFDVMSLNAEAHSPFEFPRGLAITTDYGAPIEMDLMKRNRMRVLVVCDLAETAADDDRTPLTKEYFQDKRQIAALRRAVPQFSSIPPRTIAAGPETEHWEAELGTHGWVSVAATKSRSNGTRTKKHFHLAVEASAGKLDTEYYDWIKENHGSMTMGDLASHPVTARVEQMAKRNAMRIAYQAARALGVKVASQRDNLSVYAKSREFYAPLMASPTFMQISNVMKANPRERTVTVHSGTTPVTSTVDNHVFVLFNPQDGFGGFTVPVQSHSGTSGSRQITYPHGMRKEFTDQSMQVYGKAPPHIIPNAQCHEVSKKFAPNNRYSAPDATAIRLLSNDSGEFQQYKHVALLVADPHLQR